MKHLLCSAAFAALLTGCVQLDPAGFEYVTFDEHSAPPFAERDHVLPQIDPYCSGLPHVQYVHRHLGCVAYQPRVLPDGAPICIVVTVEGLDVETAHEVRGQQNGLCNGWVPLRDY